MKKVHLLSAACAALGLASCSNDEFTGMVPNEEVTAPQLISFSGAGNANSRAKSEGAAAAKLLNNRFWVYGAKGDDAASLSRVFDNYTLEWDEAATGKSETNPKGWEYVGKTSKKGAGQDAKYWDYSADLYQFVAVAGLGADELITDTRKGFSVKIDADDPATDGVDEGTDWTAIYFADRVSASPEGKAATATTPEMIKYQDVVTFNFRRLAAKMRVGFYETIPGYAVRNVKFYYRGAETGTGDVGLSSAFPHDGTFTVTYDDADNVAHAALKTGTTYASNTFGRLIYTKAISKEGIAGKEFLGSNGGAVTEAKAPTIYLATEASDPTWAVGTWTIDHETKTSEWKPILPNEKNKTGMTLLVNFELVSLDGSRETIYVKNALCTVPAEYCQWKPNYAYTYLFKISDNVKGTTDHEDPGFDPDPDKPDPTPVPEGPDPGPDPDPTDPFNPHIDPDPVAGLYPITFDAFVMDETELQETITTVSDPSITTYAPESDVTTDNEYKVGTKISLIVANTKAKAWEVCSAPSAAAVTELEAATLDKNGNTTWVAADGDATTGYSFTPAKAGYYTVRLTYVVNKKDTYAYKVIRVK